MMRVVCDGEKSIAGSMSILSTRSIGCDVVSAVKLGIVVALALSVLTQEEGELC